MNRCFSLRSAFALSSPSPVSHSPSPPPPLPLPSNPRTVTLDCLTEIASLPAEEIPENYKSMLMQLFVHMVGRVSATLGAADLARTYEAGSDETCLFIDRLALFLSTYLKSYLHFFELPDGTVAHQEAVLEAMSLLLRISNIDNEDLFKVCLEFWGHFAKEMFTKGTVAAAARGIGGLGMMGFQPLAGATFLSSSGLSLGGVGNGGGDGGAGGGGVVPLAPVPQHQIFADVLHNLRITMIDHMAKPEEVIVVEEEGEIVREQTKDTEVIAQYKTMREAIVYLTHLHFEDTENIMCDKLEFQVANYGANFTWSGLNTLCWAIGSISGAMSDLDEKRFLVAVIRDLLKLCEEQRGKDNKAVVASNIMYIVGQYPRFLRAHWKFLKTVVNKLFEFMHEQHPGVQDMACDTFLKIAKSCKRKFMTPQTEDPVPFIVILIRDIRRHTADLLPHQVLSFYESVGTMLSDKGQEISAVLQREEVVMRLMDVANESWRRIMVVAGQDPNSLKREETIKELRTVLRINSRVCYSAGSIFVHQLSVIFLDALNLYRYYGEQIKEACVTQGDISVRFTLYKAMRGVKSDVLELMASFFEAARELEGGPQSAMPTFLPSLMDEVLMDYRAGPSAARDAKVLSLCCTVVTVLKEHVDNEIPRIMEAIFEPTLEMITSNMLDNPDHRINFFKFLREANEHCFSGLFSIQPAHQKLIIDSIVWAFKHTERNIGETGLEILQELLQNIVKSASSNANFSATFAQPFYQLYLLALIQEVLGIMTDRLHKSGFKLQASVLMHLFHLVQAGQVQIPLYDAAACPDISDNAHFLKEHVARLLLEAFPNLSTPQIVVFVSGLFDISKDINAFKQHLRDFLVSFNVHENEDNSLYFDEEKLLQQKEREDALRQYQESVPGLLKPSELAEIAEDF